MDIRKQCGIFGLLIGIGTILVFWLLPFERKPIEISGNTNFHEAIFIILMMFWILSSAAVKITMILKKRILFTNFASLILFFSFISIGIFLPHQNNTSVFHLWHEFFGLALIFGWSFIDTVDFSMIYLSEKW